MPTGNLSESGKKLYEKVYNEELKGNCKGDKECAAKRAWGAVKNAGWSKDAKGNWHKKAELQEFSLVIKRLFVDEATNTKRWKADTSDTVEDSHGDNMTIELFKSFINRINANEPAPEEFKSDYWDGGKPYLSISHYSDLNGQGVPGEVENVFVDGRFLKAKGEFYDNPLGNAAWNALMEDQKTKREDKVRISIGFLDYGHVHKDGGFKFARKSLDDFCPECLRSMMNGERSAKSFTDGMLVHLALTRVPVNKRTDISPDMEVKSEMITQFEDAESIVGEDQAEMLNELKKASIKSEALVEFSEVEEVDKANKKKQPPMEDEETPSEDETEDNEEDDKKKKKEMMKSDLEKESSPTELDLIRSELEEIKSALKERNMPEQEGEIVEEKSELYPAFQDFATSFEEVNKSDANEEEKLRLLQEPFNVFAEAIKSNIRKPVVVEEPVVENATNDLVKALSEALSPIVQKLDLLYQVQTERSEVPNRVPSRRSIDPALATPALLKQEAEIENKPGQPVKIGNFVKKSVGLQ